VLIEEQSAGSVTRATVGFQPRLIAGLIDSLFTMAIFLPPMYVLFGPSIFGVTHERPGTLYTVLSIVIPAIIIMMFWLKISTTPGKMLIRSVIVDADTGGAPTLKQWILRYLGYYVAAIPFGIGLLWVMRDPRHQGWHDKMANTLVVRK